MFLVPNSTDNENVIRNVPHLRFPEFEGEWSITTLQKDCIVNPINEKIADKFVYVDLESVTQGQLNKHQILTKEEAPSRAQRVLHIDDILFQCVRPYQMNNYIVKDTMSDIQWVASTGYAQIRTQIDYPIFLYYVLNTPKYNKAVMVRCTGSSYPAINSNDLFEIPFYKCGILEQKKIASFLSLLDERIATQNKIIEDLKKLKCAIIDEVFCSPKQREPNRRFEGCSEPLSTYKMKDFCFRITDKNKANKCSLVLTIAAQYGLVDQESFFNKSVASENLTGYYILNKGDFAYNRSYSSGYAWGAVKRLDNYSEGVLSTLYVCFRADESIVNSDYLSYYFESSKWHKEVSDISGEGARNHGLLNISVSDYFNTEHRFATMTEQKRIASMLNAIVIKEQNAIKLGKLYSKQKQYLLRQMFI